MSIFRWNSLERESLCFISATSTACKYVIFCVVSEYICISKNLKNNSRILSVFNESHQILGVVFQLAAMMLPNLRLVGENCALDYKQIVARNKIR